MTSSFITSFIVKQFRIGGEGCFIANI